MLLLSEIEHAPETSQRHLALRLGLSVGMVNLLLRNLARKGYVRVTRAGWRRWLYAMTPSGASRKVQLLVGYVRRFLGDYQRVRGMLREQLAPLSLHAESRVAIYGTGELAELVYLSLRELAVEEVEVFDTRSSNGRKFLGLPVRDVSTLRPEDHDRVVIAVLPEASRGYEELRAAGVSPERLVTLFGERPRRDEGIAH